MCVQKTNINDGRVILCKRSLRVKIFRLIAALKGGFLAQHIWEMVGRKNLIIFKGFHYSQFHILISLSFRKIETKNLDSDQPRVLILLVLGTTSPAAYQLS